MTQATLLHSVQRRIRQQHLLNCLVWGLFAAAVSLWLLPLGLAVGFVIGLYGFQKRTLKIAAKITDESQQLHDRCITAIELSEPPQDISPIAQLQLADTAQHLSGVKPAEIFPLRIPYMFYLAVVSIGVSQGIHYVSGFHTETIEMPEWNVSELLESLPDVIGEELKKPKSVKEQLATLSKIQEKLQKDLRTKSEDKTASFKEIAEALNAVKQLKPAAQEMLKENYAKAAENLKSVDALEKMQKAERSRAEKELQKTAENAKNNGQKSLEQAAKGLAEGLKKQNPQEFQKGKDILSEELQKQAARQQAEQSMSQALAKVAEAKAKAAQDGGKDTDKSAQASKNFGRGSAKNPNSGEQTTLNGVRQQQTVKGQIGKDGDSEKEKSGERERPDKQETASVTDVRDLFPNYQKAAESALDSGNIPLGKRQIIRRYFTAIQEQ